jgi:hypothetical protein
MFHELWIGEKRHSALRHQLFGLAQRWIIFAMYRYFRPSLVTTSMGLYQRRLSRRGVVAEVLPLFGNIRMALRDDDRLTELLRAKGSRLAQKPRASFVSGVFFGTIHPDFYARPLIKWLKELRSQTAKPVLLTMIGRSGAGSIVLAERLVSAPGDAFEVVMLEEQSEQIISQVLQFADFGINTGSPETLGKSGTFAAMREHGLPVVLADGDLDSTLLGDGGPPVLQFSSENSVRSVMSRWHPANALGGVTRITASFLHLLGGLEPRRL